MLVAKVTNANVKHQITIKCKRESKITYPETEFFSFVFSQAYLCFEIEEFTGEIINSPGNGKKCK